MAFSASAVVLKCVGKSCCSLTTTEQFEVKTMCMTGVIAPCQKRLEDLWPPIITNKVKPKDKIVWFLWWHIWRWRNPVPRSLDTKLFSKWEPTGHTYWLMKSSILKWWSTCQLNMNQVRNINFSEVLTLGGGYKVSMCYGYAPILHDQCKRHTHNKHTITHPGKWDREYLYQVRSQDYNLRWILLCCIQQRVIFDWVK